MRAVVDALVVYSQNPRQFLDNFRNDVVEESIRCADVDIDVILVQQPQEVTHSPNSGVV